MLEASYINNWYTIVVGHLVPPGQIWIAVQMGNVAEAERLRKMHGTEFHFIFLPALEQKIQEYEHHRRRYPTFPNLLPELLTVFRAIDTTKK